MSHQFNVNHLNGQVFDCLWLATTNLYTDWTCIHSHNDEPQKKENHRQCLDIYAADSVENLYWTIKRFASRQEKIVFVCKADAMTHVYINCYSWSWIWRCMGFTVSLQPQLRLAISIESPTNTNKCTHGITIDVLCSSVIPFVTSSFAPSVRSPLVGRRVD